MTKSSSAGGKSPSDSRKARLAQALRDNLKRRKEQARDRKDRRGSPDSPEAAENDAGKPGRRP